MEKQAPVKPTGGDQIRSLHAAGALSMKHLFEHAAVIGASDLLITAGAPPMVRVDGEMSPVLDKAMGPDNTRRLIYSLLNETQQAMFEQKRELDFSLAVSGNLRFRANIFYQKGHVSGAFRLIPRSVPSLRELGLPPIVSDLTLRPNGLILVTGPTGSGKTTTMASMIDLVNRTRRVHIVTVEDPIEFIHENDKAVVDQREVYADTLSFGNALKYVLRQDPDVILVGEMRDAETIGAALTAAETGHLVIATLHTNDAVQSIDRVVDVFPPHHHDQIRVQLSFALLGVIAQKLLLRADGRGRILATEILIKNHAVANHIREGKTHQTRTIMESARREGMVTMDHRLKELYDNGLIAYETAAHHISSPAFLDQIAPPADRSTRSRSRSAQPEAYHRFGEAK
ncbi:MAG TPA: type IV pilus twitching motility protein PilT [Phycisphaerae bacterium]|nr:type IV pilus twitching motility protein PilT [Phycisphaerae bacterium]